VNPQAEVGALIARIKAEVRAGRPVIVWHAFTNAEWDVVCGFDEADGTFLGRGTYRGLAEYAREPQDRTAQCLDICPALGAIFVGGKVNELDTLTAELSALEEAVRHARWPRDPFLAAGIPGELPWRFRQGLACYEAWAQGFRAHPDRVPGAGDRYPLGVYHSTHRSAGQFLREIAPRYPRAQAQLEVAAVHFDADADALDDVMALTGGWDDWWAPDAARGAQAAVLLQSAGEHYARGIEAIAEALEAIAPDRARDAHSPARVKLSEGRVAIPGIPELRWGRGKDCSFAGALEAALSVSEHPYTYSDLMGLSGLAFRTRWSNWDSGTQWCPSAMVGELPDEMAALQRLTGWELDGEWQAVQGRDNEVLRARLVAAVEAGQPVPGYVTGLDLGLVFGYEDEGKRLVCRDYDSVEPTVLCGVGDLQPLRCFVGEHRPAPHPAAALREALAIAANNWRRQRHNGGLPGRDYWYGETACRAWLDDLRGYEAMDGQTRRSLTRLDALGHLALLDARRAAVSFLTDWACVTNGRVRDSLMAAADLYQFTAETLSPLQPSKRAQARTEALSDADRQESVALLQDACVRDAAAIGELERALACLP
jgi:hypothetical protein